MGVGTTRLLACPDALSGFLQIHSGHQVVKWSKLEMKCNRKTSYFAKKMLTVV